MQMNETEIGVPKADNDGSPPKPETFILQHIQRKKLHPHKRSFSIDDRQLLKGKKQMPDKEETCIKFYTCDAPLCPLTNQHPSRVWYEDEPICKQAPYKETPFVVMQRSLRNKRVRDTEHAYTYKEIIDECKKQGMLKGKVKK